jgi:uncharacterized protein (DUF2252 family)
MLMSRSLGAHHTDGRAARKVVPRTTLAAWDEQARGHDALRTILAQGEDRVQDLIPIRHGRMSASPWTYFRGAAAVMAADLASTPHTGITVQMCGDAHVLNFGLWRTPERSLSFDLRDFDETLPGPFEWDVKRLLASLVILARENRVSESGARRAASSAYRNYADTMREYEKTPELDIWYDRIHLRHFAAKLEPFDADELIGRLEARALKRTSRGASKKLTTVIDGERRILLRPPLRTALAGAEEKDAAAIAAAYRDSVPDHVWTLLTHYRIADTVRQVVGVGSVGMRVYLLLLEDLRTADPLFIQAKQATASVYEKFLGPSEYANHGQRVINGQRLIQSATDMFVGWTRKGGHDFYIRQFRDGKVIPSGQNIAARLAEFAGACGRVLARAHARSGDPTSIDDYLGKSAKVEEALIRFASAYADQNERDHRQFAKAVEEKTIPNAPGWE